MYARTSAYVDTGALAIEMGSGRMFGVSPISTIWYADYPDDSLRDTGKSERRGGFTSDASFGGASGEEGSV